MQVIFAAIVLVIVYRFLINNLGMEMLGVWSVVLATTSIIGIGNIGLASSSVKFVAKYLALENENAVCLVIQTTILSLATIIGIALIIAYPFVKLLLEIVVPSSGLQAALSILPLTLLSFWISTLASSALAGLEGFQRADIKGIILACSYIFFYLICRITVPHFGITGLAYSQITQNFIVLVSGWLLLRQKVRLLPVIPRAWDKSIFKEMFRYGTGFQIIAVSQLLYEPTIKGLLSKFGGLAMTGIYEMASRLILQFRAVIISTTQVVVPVMAELYEMDREKLESIYHEIYDILLYISIPTFSAIIAFSPFISKAWIGYWDNNFIFFLSILSIGWFSNTLSSLAYFTNLGTGDLRWNVIAHISIAFLNMLLGCLFAKTFGAQYIVLAWVFALVIGSSMIVFFYNKSHSLPCKALYSMNSGRILLSAGGAITGSFFFYYVFSDRLNLIVLGSCMGIIFLLICGPFLWLHPARKKLITVLRRNTEILNHCGNKHETI